MNYVLAAKSFSLNYPENDLQMSCFGRQGLSEIWFEDHSLTQVTLRLSSYLNKDKRENCVGSMQ